MERLTGNSEKLSESHRMERTVLPLSKLQRSMPKLLPILPLIRYMISKGTCNWEEILNKIKERVFL
jgi:hypothetical protein